MKISSKTNKQLSIAVGLLSFGAFVVQGLGDIWGFAAVAKQLTSTALLIGAAVNLYFLGSTSQKAISQEKEKQDENQTK